MQAVALVCGRSDLSSEQLVARNEGTGRQRWAQHILATAGLSLCVCVRLQPLSFSFPLWTVWKVTHFLCKVILCVFLSGRKNDKQLSGHVKKRSQATCTNGANTLAKRKRLHFLVNFYHWHPLWL